MQQIVRGTGTGRGVPADKLRVVAVLVKPVVIPQHGGVRRFVLYTEQAGMVALTAKKIGKMRIVTIHLEAPLSQPKHVGTVGGLAREQPHAAGRTGRSGAVGLTEQRPFFCELHQIRRLHGYAERL